jgi:hypothetical protein
MSTFRNPVGPQPARVYWRRRLVLALGLIAVIVIVILIFVRPGSGAPGGTTPTPTRTSAASPTPSSTTNPADAKACDLSKVSLEAVTDSSSYDAGVNPVLSFTVKSLATTPCTIPAGSDVQEYRITSGTDQIWDSKNCQSAPVAATLLLQPGVPKQGPTLTWDRTRSSPDTCNTARPPVTAGGASYHLEVKLGTLTSATTKQFLLN